MFMWVAPKKPQIVEFASVCFILAFIFFMYPTADIAASPTEIEGKSSTYPYLFVTKTVDQTEIILENSFIVTITIKNIGNSTAYNTTFIDDLTAPWVFEVTGLTRLSYSRIEPNQTHTFNYIIKPLTIGDFQFHSASVYYYSSEVNPTEFISYSNKVDITVIEPPKDISLANESIVWTLVIIFFVVNIILLLRLTAPKFNRKIK